MIRGFNGLPRTSLNLYLVEAGGIEPPSVSTPPQGLHAYLVLWFSLWHSDEPKRSQAIP